MPGGHGEGLRKEGAVCLVAAQAGAGRLSEKLSEETETHSMWRSDSQISLACFLF